MERDGFRISRSAELRGASVSIIGSSRRCSGSSQSAFALAHSIHIRTGNGQAEAPPRSCSTSYRTPAFICFANPNFFGP